MECLYCGKEFDITSKHTRKYCSRGCKEKSCVKRVWGSTRYKKRGIKRGFKIKSKCELCGFIPIHYCQLDIDHIDGNCNNNNPSNLQILCANCHRLKTFLNKDWERKV